MKQIRQIIQNARDPEIVMALLGIAQAIGISSALILADGPQASLLTGIMSFLRGSTMGTALSFGLMGVSHNAPRMKAKQAQQMAYAALVGMMIVSPVIIAPAVQAGIPANILAAPFARWAWAVAIATAPDMIAVAIAVSSKAPAEFSEQPAKIERIIPAKSETPPAPIFACAKCQREFATQNALNAHERSHNAKKLRPRYDLASIPLRLLVSRLYRPMRFTCNRARMRARR